jgi:hypothetical protein
MKKYLLFILLVNISLLTSAQELFVGAGSPVFMEAGASLNINGLILEPSVDYTINSGTTVTRSSDAVTLEAGVINLNFTITPKLTAYEGELIFQYEEGDLNGVAENDLWMQIYDETSGVGIWTSFAGVDVVNNNIVFDFTTPVSINRVTAGTQSVLNIETPELDFDIKVYPNPTADTVFIQYASPVSTSLYNISGQLLFTGNTNSLDLTPYSGAIFLLTVEDTTNNKARTFKLIKK